jgi:hypothetical protein
MLGTWLLSIASKKQQFFQDLLCGVFQPVLVPDAIVRET